MRNIGNIGNGSLGLASVVLGLVFCLMGSAVMADDEKSVQAEVQTKELIRQWVATERLLGEEANEWKVEQARMGELLELHVVELKLLNEELEKTGKSVAEVDGEKAELEAQVADGVESRRKLREFLLGLKPRVMALERRFPEVLKLQVEDAVDTLKAVNDETSVRDVLQATVNVLEQANTFNASVYQHAESVSIGSETWNAEVLYLGLGRAYFYVGSKAGVGVPGGDGWSWTRNDEILDEVKKAVEVYKKQKQPQLVELPVQVKVKP